jgi:REP element-mobilizing transposase RayT
MGVPRLPRLDSPGVWHHVWGRAIANKPIFETRADIRRFQAALARAVRRGDLELHSFAFLTTHFHLLVRSPRGLLSKALGRVLWDYTKHFNRGRGRSGTVWRGRFSSKPVKSRAYRRILVRYIDQNPVQAGLSDTPWSYEHGSAQRFVFRTPRWLDRSWIDEEILRKTKRTPVDGGRYQDAFPPADERVAFLGRSCEEPRIGPDPMEHLLDAAPEVVRRWLEERSLLADGRLPGHPVVDPPTLLDVLAAAGDECRGFVQPRRKPMSATRLITLGLLRDLCGLTFTAISKLVGISTPYVTTLYGDHHDLMRRDERYAQAVTTIAVAAIARVRDC